MSQDTMLEAKLMDGYGNSVSPSKNEIAKANANLEAIFVEQGNNEAMAKAFFLERANIINNSLKTAAKDEDGNKDKFIREPFKNKNGDWVCQLGAQKNVGLVRVERDSQIAWLETPEKANILIRHEGNEMENVGPSSREMMTSGDVIRIGNKMFRYDGVDQKTKQAILVEIEPEKQN